MSKDSPRFPEPDSILSADSEGASGVGRGIVTQDHDVIRRWAAKHGAEPATGEATASGPATIDVKDGGAGIRFNFPGFARFRPISWAEWFENFDRHRLTFVYEEEVADRAHELWQSRGAEHGHDQDDWFEAERLLRPSGGGRSARYRLVKVKDRGDVSA